MQPVFTSGAISCKRPGGVSGTAATGSGTTRLVACPGTDGHAAEACCAKVVVALLNGEHAAQVLVAWLAPFGDEATVRNLLAHQVVVLRSAECEQLQRRAATLGS